MRIAGLVIGLIAFVWALVRRSRGASRGETLAWAAAAVLLVTLALVPSTATPLRDLFGVKSSLTAGLMVGVIVLLFAAIVERARRRELEAEVGDLVRTLALDDLTASSRTSTPRGLAVVIPAYNEEQAIARVLADLPDEVSGLRVDPIVVVDGGTDETAAVVRRSRYTVVCHPVNRGQGDALRTGFAAALRGGAEVVMTMDADGQHRPDEMERLVKPIVADEADFVQGSRFLGQYDDAGGGREIGIRWFTRLVNLLSGAGITDCTNGYRAIRAEGLATLRLQEDRFSAPELIMEAARHGLRIKEVPVHIRARTHGTSKKPLRFAYPLGFLRTIVEVWLR
ncbi:MAG TPA: DUF2304 family protein [Acidimicrobiia bacterium]|nr:DUF2304 family protein [Acidimicrobiia bacterium]